MNASTIAFVLYITPDKIRLFYLLQSIRDTKLPELNQELENLKIDINNVNASYWKTRALVTNASQHADKLDSEARRLERYRLLCLVDYYFSSVQFFSSQIGSV